MVYVWRFSLITELHMDFLNIGENIESAIDSLSNGLTGFVLLGLLVLGYFQQLDPTGQLVMGASVASAFAASLFTALLIKLAG